MNTIFFLCMIILLLSYYSSLVISSNYDENEIANSEYDENNEDLSMMTNEKKIHIGKNNFFY
jgi:hypothetical protein